MDLGLTGRVAIVTGGSRGIGYACAAALLAEGAHVVVASVDPARNAAAAKKLQQVGQGRALGVATDLTRIEQVKALFSRIVDEFGQLDILVNNAAAVNYEDFFKAAEEGWCRLFEHKLNGFARCIRQAVPLMRERGWAVLLISPAAQVGSRSCAPSRSASIMRRYSISPRRWPRNWPRTASW